MKILSAQDTREWDQYTIQNEPVSSLNLMERAAEKCVEWLLKKYPDTPSFAIFCGKGNNGGDGLAIARLLMAHQYDATVYVLEFGHKGTDDFQTNLARLNYLPNHDIHFIQTAQNFHPFKKGQVIIDALFGSGLNRKIEGITAALVAHINTSGCEIVSIDLPSGLYVDSTSKGNITIHANHTLCFQSFKLAFLIAENAESTGEIHLLDIGLHHDFYQSLETKFELTDENIIRTIHKPRKTFAHKGNYGHSLLIAGSYGKIGAAVLSAKACLRSGTGLLTCHVPKCGYEILQTSVPEAMVVTDINSAFNSKIDDDLTKYEAIGIGPGIGTASETKMMLRDILDSYRSPVVLDADALNIIAAQKDLLKLIPGGSILTPHPKEFERLFGESADDFDRIQMAIEKAKELNCIIVLKGHHTFIATIDGHGFFNNTGNAGMATAGSGDVLTGILTGLLAQGYSSIETAVMGVYIHGLAGDLAAEKYSEEAMVAGDIVASLGKAFKGFKLLP